MPVINFRPPPLRPVFRVPRAKISPVLRPILRPILRPTLRPILRPIVRVQQAADRPVVRPVIRPIIRVQQPKVAGGHLAGLGAAVERLLPPLSLIRGEGLRLQATAAAQLAAVRDGFAHLAAETGRFDRQLIAAEVRSARPLEGLRRDEARYAAAAARQRETLIRSSDRQVTLLRKIAKNHHGPLPGHGHTPPGHGSQAARVHAQTGGRG